MNLLKNSILLRKVKAGALQFTIAFALLVLMIMISFLLFNQLKGSEVVYIQINQGLSRDIDSAVLIMEESPAYFEKGSSEICLNRDFFIDSVHVMVKDWACFQYVSFQERHYQFCKQKGFLFTDNIHRNKLRPSLYLSDPNKYLSVGGKTYLGANTYLPGFGVRKAYLDGVGFYRDSLVQGKANRSLPNLPDLNNDLKDKFKKDSDGISSLDSIIDLVSIKADTIENSFLNKRLVIKCPNGVVIENLYVRGNIILLGTEMEIKNSVTLENCIVLAQSITIEKRFCGSAQFISQNSINAGDSCKFFSPSVLYQDGDENCEGIHLGSACYVTGDIIQPSNTLANAEALTIGENTKIIGQVYCNGLVSFKGTLFGSMFCNGFMLRTPRGVFSNYLIDVCIDYDRLPKQYAGVSLTSEKNGKKCMLEVF